VAKAEKIELERIELRWANVSAWRVIDRRPVSARFLARGWAEIQDLGSQAVAPFLEVEPGQTVIDACAGAGGKTLHLADLMNHRGSLLALDVVPRKLKTLEERAQRAGAVVQTQLWSAELRQRLKNHADRVLVDAPCSGAGTWRRQPDLKWRTTRSTVEEQVRRQREILMQAADWVRPGGKLVYATCSVFPAENADQVAWFSAQRADFVYEDSRQLWPHEHGTDGFFMVRWQRR
jgi:16S rRNA (cytosine967-C5)-methyltransferase